MRKKNYKGRVVKRSVSKCSDICRTYDPIMTAYADLKKGSYDRIYIEFDPEQNTDGGKLSWKGSGGITVKKGVIFAGKVTKPDKPATLTISCGKTKGKITVVVTD